MTETKLAFLWKYAKNKENNHKIKTSREEIPIAFKLIQLNLGEPKEFVWNNQHETSAIGKVKATEAFLSKAGFHYDGVANTKFHGGPDRAVCLYPYEHYTFWEKEFKQRLEFPGFGENITVG